MQLTSPTILHLPPFIPPSDEGQVLINEDVGACLTLKRSIFSYGKGWVKEGLKVGRALIDGAAKAYSPFLILVIVYDCPGLELLAPVLLGSAISLSDYVFTTLHQRDKQNKILADIAFAAKEANLLGIGYLADWGFSWNMILTLAPHLSVDTYLNTDELGKVIALVISVGIGLLIRYIRYRQAKGNENHPILETIANTLRAAGAPTFILRELKLQGFFTNTPLLPLTAIVTTGILGFFANVLKSCWPKLTVLVNSVITLIENASLATALLSFPVDIYAAENRDEVAESFFDSFAALSVVYWLGLAVVTGKEMVEALDKLNSPQGEEEGKKDVEAGLINERSVLLTE